MSDVKRCLAHHHPIVTLDPRCHFRPVLPLTRPPFLPIGTRSLVQRILKVLWTLMAQDPHELVFVPLPSAPLSSSHSGSEAPLTSCREGWSGKQEKLLAQCLPLLLSAASGSFQGWVWSSLPTAPPPGRPGSPCVQESPCKWGCSEMVMRQGVSVQGQLGLPLLPK